MGDGFGILDILNDEKKLILQPWMKSGDFKFILVTEANITECIDSCINGVNKRFALDLETTGIDNRVFDGETRDKIVGVCLSGDGIIGWYIPLRHKVGAEHNVSWSVFDREFRRLIAAVMEDRVSAIFHNGKFDQEFLEFNGGEPYGDWAAPKRWDDTLILSYLRHSRSRLKGLKPLSEAPVDADNTHPTGGPGLGMKMLGLGDLFPEGHPKSQYDYSLLNPAEEGPLIYGCSDAICTYKLCDLLKPAVLQPKDHPFNQRRIYLIEKGCVAGTRWMERNRLNTDPEKVMELIKLGQQEWYDSIMDVYQAAGKILGRDVMPGYYKVMQDHWVADDPMKLLRDQLLFAKSQADIRYPNPMGKAETRGVKWPLIYDVNAPKQLGQMFEEMGVPGLIYTEKSQKHKDKTKWQVKTAKDVLERIIAEAESRFPFMSKIKRFREVNKALSSYLFPMLEDVDPNDHSMRISFNAHKVDTGRFSTPARGGDLASARKKRIAGWPAVNLQSVPATYDPRRPECMTRIRECVVPRPNHFIVAIDFAGEELRLVTNLAKEPKWLDEFFRCSSCSRTFSRGDGATTPKPPPARCPNCGSDKIGDLHTLTALGVYGKDATRRPEWKQLRGNGKCVHPDTIVWVDGVPIPIGTLPTTSETGFMPYKGSTRGPGGLTIPIVETYQGGEQDLFHIVTIRGIVTCSAQHQFQTKEGSLVSIEKGLVKGVVLADPPLLTLGSAEHFPDISCKPHRQVPDTWIKTTIAHAYFSGLYMGDGSASSTSVTLCHGHVSKIDPLGFPYQDWQDLLMGACEATGLTPVRRVKGVYLGSRQVMRWMAGLGLVNGAVRTFRIPGWVWRAGREGLLQFLGGLIDTDGYVNSRDHIARICTKDYIFAGQIAEALRLVGCTPTVQTSWNKVYKRWYLVIGTKRNDSIILRPYVRHPKKRGRLYSGQVKTLYYPNKVKLVVPAGRHLCFDLHVDSDDHLYIANGLLTHNSTNFALCYGGGGKAVVRAIGDITKNEGWRIKNQFDATYSGLKMWWGGMHSFAAKYGFVLTGFGRVYPVPDIWSSDSGFRSKAERNSVNGPIQGCLHGESRIPTSQGICMIRDLIGQTFNVWTGTKWVEGRAFPSGLKRLIHTTLASGLVLRTSPDHQFRVFEDPELIWVRQEDLTPEMWVATDAQGVDLPGALLSFIDEGLASHNKKGYAYEGNHEALWELLGLVIGDGSVRSDGLIIHVGGPEAEVQARFYANRFASALGVSPKVNEKPRVEGDDRFPMWQVCIWNTAFREFCGDLGLGDWNTYTKRVPEAVWDQSVKCRAAFLRGYFSADGCVNVAEAVDVRSANPDLLMDTHKLLRSLGIRSTVRLNSKRVSIKDRVGFRDRVGFMVPKKSKRLQAIKTNPWTGQWHPLPRDLICKIGGVVYNSSIYAGLSRPEKSAVLRLKAGSGSKPQCLRYLAKLPAGEVPESITTLLQYDYEQMVGVEDTGEQVDMFDIEVFDDEHAFVCDGVVVHNSGADVIKIAMALVYKAMKKKGWLDLCRMIATMHDELVFEVHESIIEEAIAIINPIMTSNPFIMGKKWPVPLTTDCEIGTDWTVKWDLNEMLYREVRFEGNKKIKEPKSPRLAECSSAAEFDDKEAAYKVALATWKAMPHSFPASLRPFFKVQIAGAVAAVAPAAVPLEMAKVVVAPTDTPDTVVEVASTPTGALVTPAAPPAQAPMEQPPSGLKPGSYYDFILHAPMTPLNCVRLAEVITACKGGGTRKLRIKTSTGAQLEGWNTTKDYMVNDQQFYWMAKQAGL